MTNSNVPRLCPSQDVRPVTEFRAHASAFLDQIRATKRAVMLTQHGRCAAVLLDVTVYEDLLGELAELREAQDIGRPTPPTPDAPFPQEPGRATPLAPPPVRMLSS